MASKYPSPPASPHKLDELLMCPVCLDNYRDPRILSCLHSFCTNCLENCRRSYRRDIVCPVCKKSTPLSPLGVMGLQADFRIQQIRDILFNKSPVSSDEECGGGDSSKSCDSCKCEQKVSPAATHCIQCFMYFCGDCTTKHNQNVLFVAHHIIKIGENSKGSEVLFCRNHKEHPVRYFCKPCSAMLCTICTMNHDTTHAPEPLEKGIIEKYRKELTRSLRTVKSKLTEVKSQTKYLETIKETHQQAQYEAQAAIKEKTEELIKKIHEQEQLLLHEVQAKIEARMRQNGLDNLGEMRFHKDNMEQLYNEIQQVVKGTPQDCLVAYEELVSRLKSLSDTALPAIPKSKAKSVVKFIPAIDDLRIVIGTLQECTMNDDDPEVMEVSTSFTETVATSPKPRRVTSILNAMSPGRNSEYKLGKVKASGGERPKSPSRKINADELIATTSSQPASPAEDSSRPKLLFKVDQRGGWPGKVTTPNSLAFLPNGNVVVAECQNRLQVFDTAGKSIRIIGWGKIYPQGVAVMSDGRIAITDLKDHCIKIFSSEGECSLVWGAGMFRAPSGIAALSNGNLVITDIDRHSINIHRTDGSLITTYGSRGTGDYQFNNPAYVTADKDDNIYVSDSANSCIKVFNSCGVFIRKLSVSGSNKQGLRRPLGLAVNAAGNILIADRDNHQISLLSADGHFIQHMLSKQDGLRYPCDVKVNSSHVGVVESYSGFMSKEPHHAVRLFKLPE